MHTMLRTPTPNLAESVDFYRRLGFTVLRQGETVRVSDRSVIIEIDPHRSTRAGVCLAAPDWEPVARELAGLTQVHRTETGYLAADPSNVWLYLVTREADFDTPPNTIAPSALGNCAGLSLETTDIARSVRFWQTLGFAQRDGSADNGFVALQHPDGLVVNCMAPLTCPHLFFNPSLTYFNGSANAAVIEAIRQLAIPITEEITVFNDAGVVDNIIVRDPGGFGFFVFND